VNIFKSSTYRRVLCCINLNVYVYIYIYLLRGELTCIDLCRWGGQLPGGARPQVNLGFIKYEKNLRGSLSRDLRYFLIYY
jgi:hypothetical protein